MLVVVTHLIVWPPSPGVLVKSIVPITSGHSIMPSIRISFIHQLCSKKVGFGISVPAAVKQNENFLESLFKGFQLPWQSTGMPTTFWWPTCPNKLLIYRLSFSAFLKNISSSLRMYSKHVILLCNYLTVCHAETTMKLLHEKHEMKYLVKSFEGSKFEFNFIWVKRDVSIHENCIFLSI